LSIAGDSKAIEIERSEQVRNAIGAPQVYSVTAPATDDGRGALARFHDVVIIQRTNGIRVLEHHLRVGRDQGEKIEHHKPLKAELLGEAQNSPALAPGPPVSLLCTSRRRSLPWISRAHSLEVKSFSRGEAESIFRIYLGDETVEKHRDALLEFAERVECLPIAIVVGADLLLRELDPVQCSPSKSATRATRWLEKQP
jgi:hypothetical protein